MKKLTFLVVILFLMVGVFLPKIADADILDYATKFSPKSDIAISSATTAATEVFATNGSRKDLYLDNDGAEAYTIYLGYDSNVTTYTTTAHWKLATGDTMTLEDFIGTIYGISTGTTTMSGWELTFE